MKRRLFIVASVIAMAILGILLLLNKASSPSSVPSVNPESQSDAEFILAPSLDEEIQKTPFRPTRLPPQPIVESPSLVVPEPKSKLSEAVQTIINGTENRANYNDYRVAMLQLTRKLSDDDISALMDFLNQKATDRSDMRAIEFNGVKNDVLDVLLRQETLPKGIGLQLVEMYNDKSFDTMWRDYCVQFIANYYERRWIYDESSQTVSKEADAKDAEREVIEAVYWDALKETDTTIAGTALLGLNSLSQQDSTIDRERVSQVAVDLLSNPEVGEPTRITAFSIAASLDNQKALPEARVIAQTGETVTLRMVAIAAIGRLGSVSDIELLNSLSLDSEERIRRIAKSALEIARSRISQQSVQTK